jgi:hypothetical protein
MLIPVTYDAWPTRLKHPTTIMVGRAQLAHALFVTGRAPGDRARFGLASRFEALHRTSIVPSYLKFRAGGIYRSPLANSLDRSEKAGLSYNLGQALTQIFCQQALGVPHLLHFDRYQATHGVRLVSQATRHRPDFLGRPTGSPHWVVAESKGRSQKYERTLPADIATQKSVVRSVAGCAPFVSMGSIAFVDSKTDQVSLHVVDPPENEVAGVDVTVDDRLFLLAYYGPFLELFDSVQAVRTDDFENTAVVTLTDLQLRVGLRTSILLELLRLRDSANRSVEGITGSLSNLADPEVAGAGDGGGAAFFPDGSLFEWLDGPDVNEDEVRR